jgi:hypothetical protein
MTRFEVALLISMVAAGCAARMGVGAHIEHGFDASRYNTFAWAPPDALPAGDPRLDQNPAFTDRVRGAVEKGLSAKGLVPDMSASADLLVHYHASVSRRIDVDAADRLRGYCTPDGCLKESMVYDAGTLVLDIVDARTNRVIWRGWAQSRVEQLLDEPVPGSIERGVELMLKRFPGGR